MKVFISWSGDRSKHLALALRDWLKLVIQRLEPWVSDEDIQKGAAWLAELNASLDATAFGIVCVTPENQHAPWLIYESGAMATTKGITKARVAPVLLGLTAAEVVGPLQQFQHTLVTKAELLKLVASLNSALANDALPELVLKEAFELAWPGFEKKLASLPKAPTGATAKRTEGEMLAELVDTARQNSTALGRVETFMLGSVIGSPLASAAYMNQLAASGGLMGSPLTLRALDDATLAARAVVERSNTQVAATKVSSAPPPIKPLKT